MEKAPAFVVPAGVVFEIADDGVTIENRGDVVLHTTFGRLLKRVVSSEGSIELHGDVSAGAVAAHGNVTVHGALAATSIDAGGDVAIAGEIAATSIAAGGSVRAGGDASVKQVHAGGHVSLEGNVSAEAIEAAGSLVVGGAFTGGLLRGGQIDLRGPVTARGVQASHAVQIAGVKISVDAIIAPEVFVQPGTGGRAPIIECQNELGPNQLKGKFRLADWEETFGSPAQYLAERGLSAPGDGPPPALPPPPAPPAAVEPDPPVTHAEPAPVEPIATEPAPSEPTPATAMEVEIDEADDATAAGGSPPAEHPLHGDLTVAVNKIIDCYGEAEVPPAVARLHELIETRSYDQVRSEITSIWSDLLKFHQKKGLRIQHQVTTTFNTINSLVKKM